MAVRTIRVKVGERWYTVEVEDVSGSPVKATVEGKTFYIEVEGLSRPRPVSRSAPPPSPPQVEQPQVRQPAPVLSEKVIRSPMAGKVLAVNVRQGDTVSSGQEVCVLEAMKMEQSILAPADGVVKQVYIQPLQQVGGDDPLMEME